VSRWNDENYLNIPLYPLLKGGRANKLRFPRRAGMPDDSRDIFPTRKNSAGLVRDDK
jgi:hypothetical protein